MWQCESRVLDLWDTQSKSASHRQLKTHIFSTLRSFSRLTVWEQETLQRLVEKRAAGKRKSVCYCITAGRVNTLLRKPADMANIAVQRIKREFKEVLKSEEV